MDQGILQKEQATKFKRIVSQVKSKRQRQRSLQTTYSSQNLEGLQTEKASSETLPPSTPHLETTGTQTSNLVQDNFQFQISEIDLRAFDDLEWDSPFNDTISSSQNFFIQGHNLPTTSEEHIPNPLAINNCDLDFNVLLSQHPSSSAWPTGLEANIGWDNDFSQKYALSQEDSLPQANCGSALTSCESVQHYSHYTNRFPQQSAVDEELNSTSMSQEHSASTLGSSWYFASQPTGQSTSNLCSIAEDALFIYYLDHVFYIQYPFYHSFGGQGRGWLFSILTRAKSTYHATLALSEHYQHRTTLNNRSIANGSDHLRAKGGHYDIALREMQHSLEKSDAWNGPTGLSQSIHVLTCILQLLFSDVREILSFNILDTD